MAAKITLINRLVVKVALIILGLVVMITVIELLRWLLGIALCIHAAHDFGIIARIFFQAKLDIEINAHFLLM